MFCITHLHNVIHSEHTRHWSTFESTLALFGALSTRLAHIDPTLDQWYWSGTCSSSTLSQPTKDVDANTRSWLSAASKHKKFTQCYPANTRRWRSAPQQTQDIDAVLPRKNTRCWRSATQKKHEMLTQCYPANTRLRRSATQQTQDVDKVLPSKHKTLTQCYPEKNETLTQCYPANTRRWQSATQQT